MYRNITYSINKEAGWRGEIRLDTWNEDGEPITIIEPHKSYLYYEHPEGERTSIFDTKVTYREFNSVIERKKWIERNPGRRLFEKLTPIREYLIQQFGGFQEEPDFQKYPLKTFSLDIEVASEDEFPYPDAVKYPINLITCKQFYATADVSLYAELDKKTHEFVFLATTEDIEWINTPTRTYFAFDNEHDMLLSFVRWFNKNYPDILTGWNLDGFDIPYITNRVTKVLGDEYRDMLSPVGRVYPRNMKVKDVNTELCSYNWSGVSIIDYMYLYKYKMQVKSPYYKLDYVSKKELGIGKREYVGSIKEFWKNNFREFVEYNVDDTDRVIGLDRKLNFLAQVRLLCNIGLCEYEAIYKSAPYIYGGIVLQAHQMDRIVLSDTGETIDENDEGFDGAFVYNPVPNFYDHGVFSFDLDSLYPNIIIMCNISPETKVGKITTELDGKIRISIHSKSLVFENEEQLNAALDGKLVRAANDVLYMNPKLRKGVIPAFLERHYDARRVIKKEGKTYEKQAVKEKDPIKKRELEAKAKLFDLYQNARKVMLNSTYGQLGSKYFQLFDIDNAEAITLTGQKTIKASSSKADSMIAEMSKKYTDLSVNACNVTIYMDTDSLYLNGEVPFREALGGRHPDFKNRDELEKIQIYIKAMGEDINSYLAEEIQKKFCHSPLKRLNFKVEAIADRAIWLAPKNYVVHTLIKEGVEQFTKDGTLGKFKYVGVAIQKNELPDAVKNALKDIVENGLLEGWDSKKYNDRLTHYWKIYQKMDWNEISFIASYGTHKDPDGFLDFAKGTHHVIKAVTVFNQILKKLGLNRKYMEAVLGDKVRLCNINADNQYHVEKIAWPSELPKEMKEIFSIDYEAMFEKTILKKLKKFEVAFKWKRNSVLNEYEVSLDDL